MAPGSALQRKLDPGAGGTGVDLRYRLVEARPVPAPEILPLQEHLRRVHDLCAHDLGQPPLAGAEEGPGVGVLPADVVPVVDVQGDRHDAVRAVTPAGEGGKPAVGRGAAIAAFRGIELY